MPACCFASLALDAKACLEQRVVRRRQRLRPAPWHGTVAVALARGRSHDQVSIPELRAVQRQRVLQDQLRGIFRITILVALDVEADHIPSLGKQTLGPTAQTAEQVDSKRALRLF